MGSAKDLELPGLMGGKPAEENLSTSEGAIAASEKGIAGLSEVVRVDVDEMEAKKGFASEKVSTSGIGMAGLAAIDRREVEKEEDFDVTDSMIPSPTGFHILVALPEQSDTFGGSVIVRSEKEKENDRNSCVAVRVIAMGPDCYSDKGRFPNGPWCQVGDYILIQSYAGTKFKVMGRDLFRIINDDTVEAVIEDPTAYSRI